MGILHRETAAQCVESTHSTQPPLRKLTVYSVALLCVRVRKSNFWENSFTTFSSVPVSRVSIQVYFTQVKITILFYMYFFHFFLLFFPRVFFIYLFVLLFCFFICFFRPTVCRLPVSSLQCFGEYNFRIGCRCCGCILFIVGSR